jgi:hypothetical protein
MNKYKKVNTKSRYLGFVGAIVLLPLLSPSGPYAPLVGVQYPLPQQQSATITFATTNNATVAPSSVNTTITSTLANATTMVSIPNATLVEFASNIEQIRGHLDQALFNRESGNNTLALAHTLHPIEEVYSNIEDQLANENSTLNQTLSAALQNLSSSITNASLPDVENHIDHINMLLNNGVQAIVSTSQLVDSNLGFNASVVARLLDVSGHEYEEAISNGTIKAIVEYQDAQAFIDRAQSLFNSSASRINQSMAHEVEEIHQFFSTLNSAVNNKDDPANIERTINGMIHDLSEITGLSESQLAGQETVSQEQDPIAIIDNIKSLLNQQLLAAYRSQDYGGAESVAIEAYLENYENIEEPIAEHDRPLMEQTEVMLREELRQMISDKVPIEQIEQQVTMINANLDRAAELLH